MCAINGCSWSDSALVERMNVATKHRGPDGTRIINLGDATLGFNRLAIIDLDIRAMQPMQTADGRCTIVFNGEIYNYRELKKELSGYPWRTESDTEVILAAYTRWGSGAFSKLNGMFALALWDQNTKELVLARDQVGIKPLYYHLQEGKLAFSSEMKGLLEVGMPRTIDQKAFQYFMRLMYVPKDMTMIKGIKKLLPGQVLTFKNGTGTLSTYTSWATQSAPKSYAEGVQLVHDTVTQAVQRQLVSDRPVGVYLSGGIDSSVVLSAGSKVHPSLNTFSVGYQLEDNEDPQKFNADSALAKKTAEHFGATHNEYLLSASVVHDLFPQMIHAMDEPVGNSTTLAQLFLAQQTKDTATVVLSGEGGDELFGGYDRYRLALSAARVASFIPPGLERFLPQSLRHIRLSGVDRYVQLMYTKDTELNSLLKNHTDSTRDLFAQEFTTDVDIAAQLMSADEHNWLVDEALLRADTMGMGASIEARVPLLDLEVRSLAHALPRSWKVDSRHTKKILKEAFKAELPDEVLRQPKRGWFSPGAKWLRRPEFIALTGAVFADGYTEASALFNLSAVRHMELEHREMRGYYFTVLWATLVFLSWAREYKVTL